MPGRATRSAGCSDEGLNQAQGRAVDHRDGPLIVLAGPGTGKTRVIVHRVARMIRDGIEPERIVAVTFTVKAAGELRERLAEAVGPAAADGVHAHTFHGFGQRLVSRFADLLGLPPEPTIIDGAQRRRLAREVVRRGGVLEGDGLVAEGLESLIEEGLRHIEAFRHLGKFPEDVEAFAAEWAGRLEADGTALEAEALEAERARRARFAGFARLYTALDAECRRRGQLSYEDLILLPIRLLRGHAGAAAIVRDDYRHVVVDEFQDVNAGQIELLRLMCPAESASGAPRDPDLCVVGDDDQSIYLFRGADDRAFARFRRHWPRAAQIELTENYRSERPILEAARVVIERAEPGDRFAPDKVVEPASERREAGPGAGVEGVATEDDYQYGETIAAMLLTERARAPGRAWRECAVIARGHLDLARIGAALSLEDIPFRVARGPGAMGDAGVQDVLRWVELLADPAADHAAWWLLTRPPIAVPSATVQEWARLHAGEASRHAAGESGRRDAGPFVAWLRRRAGEAGGDPRVRRFLELLDACRETTSRLDAHRALLELIRRADIVHADLADERGRATRVTHLAGLLRFAADRLALLDPPRDLRAFWMYFQDLSDKEREEVLGSDPEDRLDGGGEGSGSDEDAVALLTAHAAKGLEFDTVFVVRVSPGPGFPKTKGGDDDIELPPGLEDRAGDERGPRERRRAEERRLFYVACTRARRRLVLMARATKGPSSSTNFLQELAEDRPALMARCSAADVFARAREAGVRLAATGVGVLGDATAREARQGRRETLDLACRLARLDAARALESVDHADASAEDVDRAATMLREAAGRLAIAAHLRSNVDPPAWASDEPALAAHAAALKARLAGTPGAAPTREAPKPPLNLSYSYIDAYLECPRCFYLKNVVRVPEPEREELAFGKVAHEALRAYFNECRGAEADGRRVPGSDRLAEIGRRAYFGILPDRARADPEELRRLDAMLRLTHERLHRAEDSIEQLESGISFGYEHRGVVHRLTAKLDRLDGLGEGRGHRIIDYKTGTESKKLLEPKGDDLQLGIYALALRHHQRVPLEDRETPAVGVAEYWHLPTGQRGCIDLGQIRYDRIRATIGRAIDGILAGKFPRGEECRGLCAILDPDE